MTTPIGITLNLDGAKQVQAGLAGVSKSMESVGVSAAQTAAAMRMIPAQFTDIVVGLSSGQAPLTVLLQQGGQLKDMFGGAGAAAKALGTYVVGLVNPFTLAAAAVGVLAVAYNQGSKEADAYRLALVGTGNAVGSTVGQLKTYAQEIAGVIGTQGKAAESLAAFVSTGKVSRDVLKESAQAAVAWERASGQAVEKTAKQFADLAKDPLDAVLKLNEGTNFLTVSVYRQIKGLEEQGKTAEAAAAAQRAYAQALTGRSNEITQNLGYIETAWNGITTAAKKSWDAMLNVGRASTPADASAELRARLTRQQQELADKKAINPNADTSGMEKGIEVLKQRLGLLESDERQQRRLAAAEAERADILQRLAQWDKEGDQFKQKSAKRDEEINKTEVKGRALIAAGLIKEADLHERIANIKKQYQESGSAGTGENEVAAILARNEERARYLQRLQQQIAGVGALTDDVKPTQSEELVTKLQKELATSIKGVARAQKEKALAAAEAGVQTDKDIVAAEKQKKALTELQGLMGKQVDAVQKQADAIRDQAVGQEAVNANFGKSKTAIEQATLAQLKLQLAEADSSDRFAPAYVAALNAKTEAQQRYVEALQQAEYLQTNQKLDEAARVAQEETVSLQLQTSLLGASRLERERIIELRKVDVRLAKELADIEKLNLGTGDKAEKARQALKDKAEANALVERNNAAAKVVLDEWERTAEQINQSLTDALLRGFESGEGFAQNLRDTISNMFRTLVLRPIISAVLNPVAGAVSGVVNSAVGSVGTSMLTSAGGSMLGSSVMGGALGGLSQGFGATMSNGLIGGFGTNMSNFGTLATGGEFSAALGTIAPYALAVGALYSIIKGLDDSGTYHTGGAAQYNAMSGLTSGSSGANYNIGFGQVESGASTISAVGSVAQGLGSALDAMALAFGRKAGYEVATAFADDTSKDGAWGALRISKDGKDLLNWNDSRMSKWAPKEFADGQAGYQEYLAAIAKDTRQVLLDMDLPSWADKMLKDIGESATMDQLQSVIAQIGAVQSAFSSLGNSMEMFKGLSDDMQSALLKAAGSIDALTTGAGAFYQGFYSEQERFDALSKQLRDSLGKLNLSIDPSLGDDAKKQFRAAVEAAFASGNAELAASLLAISGNFASAADYFEQLSNSAAQAAEAAAKAAKDSALKDLQNAISRDRKGLQDQAETLQKTISGISSAVEMLRSNAADLYDTVSSTAQMRAAQGMVYIEKALEGVIAGASVADYSGLSDAIGAARGGISDGVYASEFERRRDALVLAGQLSQLGDLGDLQLTTGERQLQAINSQIEYLDSLNERAQALVDGTAALTESVDTYFQRLLKLLEPADATSGTTTTPVGSPGVFSSGPSGGAPSGGYSAVSEIKDFYNKTLDPEQLRLQMWLRGWTVEDMATAANVTPDFAREYLNLPKFDIGTNYVPKDMAAIVHEGEAIVPKAFNPWANGGGSAGGGNSELIAEVRALREEVAALRASGQAIAENTSALPEMARHIDGYTNGGTFSRQKALA